MNLKADAFIGRVQDGEIRNRDGESLLSEVLEQIEGAEVLITVVVTSEPKIERPMIPQWDGGIVCAS
jgi:hypothetical protein